MKKKSAIFASGLLALALAAVVAWDLKALSFSGLCRRGTPQQVENAIKNRANVNAMDKVGLTPLMWAAMLNPDTEVMAVLINAGADVNAKNNNGFTALMLAAGNSSPEGIRALAKAGADVNASANNGKTPLMLAAMLNPNPEAVMVLLKLGADPAIRDNEGKTAIDHARENPLFENSGALRKLEHASR